MPTSDYHHISDVLHVVQQIDPASILDIGVGYGKWGVLCREVLEVYHGRLQRSTWTRRIDGVEIFEPYRNPLWEHSYDRVMIGDIAALVEDLGSYDLALCCDVIEHFEKAAGLQLLAALLGHAPLVIVTSPRGYYPQGAAFDNPSETHLSGWGRADFAPFPHLYKDVGFTFLAVVARDTAVLRALTLPQPLDALGVKRGVRELARLTVQRARLQLRRRLRPQQV